MYCERAKALLAHIGTDYEEVDLTFDGEGRSRLLAATGLMTFPQIVVDGRPIGGYREFAELVRRGGLSAEQTAEKEQAGHEHRTSPPSTR